MVLLMRGICFEQTDFPGSSEEGPEEEMGDYLKPYSVDH